MPATPFPTQYGGCELKSLEILHQLMITHKCSKINEICPRDLETCLNARKELRRMEQFSFKKLHVQCQKNKMIDFVPTQGESRNSGIE